MWFLLRADRRVTFMNNELHTRVWLGGSASSTVQARSRPKWLLPAWITDKNVLWAVDSNHVSKSWKQKRHKSWQRTHSSSNMASICCCAKGLNVSTYRAIMWKNDFSVDCNPECITHWSCAWSQWNIFMKAASRSALVLTFWPTKSQWGVFKILDETVCHTCNLC